MQAADIIQRKRDGAPLTAAELQFLLDGFLTGEVSEAQVAAWAMAVCLRGMSLDEIVCLTEVTVRSGRVLDPSQLPLPAVDQQTTGGVGDKTAIVVAPLAAACGVLVPMLGGRQLGYGGGTLDKLESIPGFRVRLALSEFRATVERCGVCIASATDEITPIDRRLGALRAATATLEAQPLIAASALSKTLASGARTLVVDVKCGSGTLISTLASATSLASTLNDAAKALGMRTQALITDMDQPLGHAVGSGLEVAEAIETLKGRGPRDVESLALELVARMLSLTGAEPALEAARSAARRALASGAGLETMRQMIAAQGGDPRVCDGYDRLPRAQQTLLLRADGDGRVARIACREVAAAARRLAGAADALLAPADPSAGLVLHKKVGDLVIQGEPLATLYANDTALIEASRPQVMAAIRIAREAPPPVALIRGILPLDS